MTNAQFSVTHFCPRFLILLNVYLFQAELYPPYSDVVMESTANMLPRYYADSVICRQYGHCHQDDHPEQTSAVMRYAFAMDVVGCVL
jgi:hypothetical protein